MPHQDAHRLVADRRAVRSLLQPCVRFARVGDIAQPLVEGAGARFICFADLGTAPELVAEGGGLVYEDADHLAALLDQPDRPAGRLACRFDWDRNSAATLDLYRAWQAPSGRGDRPVRILLIGPDHHQGSIPPYLAVLTHALRELGTTVDRLGSSGVPYDIDARRFRTTEDIVLAARQLLDSVELGSYDVVSLHSGNLEIEQLLPALWAGRRHPPVTYHVHTLAPTLFTDHIPDQHLHHRVLEGLRSVDGLVHFGHHAATAFTHAPTAVPSVVAAAVGTGRVPSVRYRRTA